MKQLTCEMCGSTDLIKQEGVFVCQTCGIKYSVEEAKKMMVEGTVEVTGTVKVDKNPEIEALLDKAYYYLETKKYDAKKKCISKDRKEAKNLFNKVHDIDPTNAQAYLGKLLCDSTLYYIEEIPLLTEWKQQRIKENQNYDLFMRYATLDEKKKMEFCFNNDTPRDELIRLLIEKNKGVFDSFILDYITNESGEAEIEEFVVPDNVISIGDYAFYSQYDIKRVKIPNGVTKIGNGAFHKCHNLENINIPDSVTEIGNDAFSDCYALGNINIPSGVTKIGEGAFFDTSLENVNIPNGVTIIGEGAFSSCLSLKNVNISNGVKEIGSFAFSECHNLTNVDMPNSIEVIGEKAFEGCSKLEKINIPSSTKKIHDTAFLKCDKLQIEVDKNNKKYTSVNGQLKDKKGNNLNEIALNKETVMLLGCASSYMSDKKLWDAENTYEKIIRINPNCATAYLGLAAIYGVSTSVEKCEKTSKVIENILIASKKTIKPEEKIYISSLAKYSAMVGLRQGPYLLDYAASVYSYDAVAFLIEQGANVNARGEFSGTPLWRLCHKPLPQNKEAEGRKIAKILLDNGAEINVSYNEVPLLNSFTDIEIRKMILEKYPNAKVANSGGCYVATCVYGSYDCPQVWTLRRYRDDTLGATWYGRLFIRTYYAISPTLVKWFGHTSWFKKLWKGKLDRMVAKLQSKGVDNTPYDDKEW